MAIKIEELNNEVQQWGTGAVGLMVSAGTSMGIQHRPGSPSPKPSLQQIVARYKKDAGIIHIVSFRFPRHLVFVHKGAGKGMGGVKGSTWYDSQGTRHKTNPKSQGKMGTGGRQPKPWFNQSMAAPDGLNALGDIVVTHLGDAFINDLFIK